MKKFHHLALDCYKCCSNGEKKVLKVDTIILLQRKLIVIHYLFIVVQIGATLLMLLLDSNPADNLTLASLCLTRVSNLIVFLLSTTKRPN